MAIAINAAKDRTRYFTHQDHQSLIFFQMPKILVYGSTYREMSSDAKLLYTICLDLIKLSLKNRWCDENDNYFIKLSNEKIEKLLNCKKDKAIKVKKELEKFGLLVNKRIGLSKSNRLYILKLETSDEDLYHAIEEHEDIENDEETPQSLKSEKPKSLEPQRKSEKPTSRSRKNRPQEVGKTDTINNDSIKTDLIDNHNLNLNPIDIYDFLWETSLPMSLKQKIKVMIANKTISLTPEQILLIQDAYHYQIEKTYVVPDCDFDYLGALNDQQFSDTVATMLEKVKKIDNMRGLIKEWVLLAFEHKNEQLS